MFDSNGSIRFLSSAAATLGSSWHLEGLIPMILNGHPGTKYGIPFPVLVRSSFGTAGSNIAALARAVVACGWFGIQTWIGGAAIYQILGALHWINIEADTAKIAFIGITATQLACFFAFWIRRHLPSVDDSASPA